MFRLNFNIISLFFLHRAIYKIHMWKLFVYGKIFAHGQTKSGRKSLVKKRQKQKQTKTKTGEKKKERVLFCQERKKILCESDWYWQSSTLASRFRTKKSPSNQNLPHLMSNTRFPFLYASTSLDTKTLTTTSNRNFGSCMSVRCLAPQNMFRFFHFCCGLFFAFGNFAHYCVVRLNALLSNRDKKKNFSAMG